MADGRDIACWDNHALECEADKRKPFEFKKDADGHYFWLREEFLKLDDVVKCLDIGCGPGYWIKLFEGAEYSAFDQSPGMITLAKKQLKENGLLDTVKSLVLGNARKLEDHYQPGNFDLVFTSSVLQHNRHDPDKREIVEGIHYILREGGYYLCTENTYREDNHPDPAKRSDYTDGYTFTPEGWEKWMRELGFELLGFNGKSEYLYRKI